MVLESTARLYKAPLEEGKLDYVLFSWSTKIGRERRERGEYIDLTTLPPIAQEPAMAPYYLVMKDK